MNEYHEQQKFCRIPNEFEIGHAIQFFIELAHQHYIICRFPQVPDEYDNADNVVRCKD
ncbi:hypothetical protein pEaSNUABM35_00300 [Erwinia phage pEa_SNUABM_35]|uniref:Uncharacterized protein n=1 Tax=Erwinia phage pEa_SNUABM_35 TaxID=2869557 RepID=A0AAE7XPZ2_9CAUD|nr:hypothetical protein MPK65_gp300 [Erwinia phage pEa_SNUABM_35]QZE60217.1 hypothetical protein pEaSNUABM35_00300 [Erwinia phage pEa_SNUABM_35]QZE60553.1 hypothetical protein pEaSNUABM36_00300 [Erwinia phage pEa_SNUABM_36]